MLASKKPRKLTRKPVTLAPRLVGYAIVKPDGAGVNWLRTSRIYRTKAAAKDDLTDNEESVVAIYRSALHPRPKRKAKR